MPYSSFSSDTENERQVKTFHRSKKGRSSSSSERSLSDSSDEDTWGRSRKKKLRRREPKRNEKKKKKDKPMWKEEGEISDSESETSPPPSRHRRRRRSDSRSRERSKERGRRREEKVESSRNRVNFREKYNYEYYYCDKCNISRYTLKSRLHHEMGVHDVDAQCHICLKKYTKYETFREHHKTEHKEDPVKCVYCKCSFGLPNEMDDEEWHNFHQHLYGETLHAKLSAQEEAKERKKAERYDRRENLKTLDEEEKTKRKSLSRTSKS